MGAAKEKRANLDEQEALTARQRADAVAELAKIDAGLAAGVEAGQPDDSKLLAQQRALEAEVCEYDAKLERIGRLKNALAHQATAEAIQARKDEIAAQYRTLLSDALPEREKHARAFVEWLAAGQVIAEQFAGSQKPISAGVSNLIRTTYTTQRERENAIQRTHVGTSLAHLGTVAAQALSDIASKFTPMQVFVEVRRSDRVFPVDEALADATARLKSVLGPMVERYTAPDSRA